MAEQQKPFDPVAFWRDMLSTWEAGVNQAFARSTEQPDVASAMQHMMGLPAQMQQAMAALMSHSLTAMTVPSRADLAAVTARLDAIERRLDMLAAIVDHNEEAAAEDEPAAKSSKPAKRAAGKRR